MHEKPTFLLSISIPTRNRAHYVQSVTEKLLISLPDYVEVVVSDNSDEPNVSLQMMASGSQRFTYVHSTDELSFSGNFNRALSLCNGSYLTAIGDDDYVLPYIGELTKFAEREQADAMVYGFNAVYYWAGVRGRANDKSGLLRIFGAGEPYAREVNQNEELELFLQSGMEDYSKTKLARIYHGIVSRNLVRTVQRNYGALYGGLSPDIYSSMLLAACSKKALYVGVPLTMPGVSPKSGSGQSASGLHRGDLRSAPHFRGVKDYEWEQTIPRFYSVQSIWAESAIKAVGLIDPTLLQRICFNRFFAKSLLGNLEIAPLMLQSLRELPLSERRRYHGPSIALALLSSLATRIAKKMMNGRRSERKTLETNDISEAAAFVKCCVKPASIQLPGDIDLNVETR